MSQKNAIYLNHDVREDVIPITITDGIAKYGDGVVSGVWAEAMALPPPPNLLR
jgi:hypothetical protein